MADALDKPRGARNQAMVEQTDRRRDPRVLVNLDAEIEEPGSRTRFKGRVTDLGVGGCYADMMTVFPVGTKVLVRISWEGEIFEAAAEVRYSKHGLGMGLTFTDLAPEERARLLGWTNDLSGRMHAGERSTHKSPASLRAIPSGSYEPGALQLLIKVLLRKGMLTHSEVEQILRELMTSAPKR